MKLINSIKSYFYSIEPQSSLTQLEKDFGDFPPYPLNCQKKFGDFLIIRTRFIGDVYNSYASLVNLHIYLSNKDNLEYPGVSEFARGAIESHEDIRKNIKNFKRSFRNLNLIGKLLFLSLIIIISPILLIYAVYRLISIHPHKGNILGFYLPLSKDNASVTLRLGKAKGRCNIPRCQNSWNLYRC